MPTAAGDDFLLFIQLPLLLQKFRGIARLGVAVGGTLKAMLLPGFRPPGHGTAQRIILHGLVIFLHFHPGCGLHLGGAAHPIVGGGGVLLGHPVPFGQLGHGGRVELGTVLRDDDLRLLLGLAPAARGGAVVGVLRDGFFLPGGEHLHGAASVGGTHGRAGAVSVYPLPVVGVGPVADQGPGRGLFVLFVDILLLGPPAAFVHRGHVGIINGRAAVVVRAADGVGGMDHRLSFMLELLPAIAGRGGPSGRAVLPAVGRWRWFGRPAFLCRSMASGSGCGPWPVLPSGRSGS